MKIDPTTFERIMSFCPRLQHGGTEKCLRDLIFSRYADFFASERADELTKEHIAKLFEQFGKDDHATS